MPISSRRIDGWLATAARARCSIIPISPKPANAGRSSTPMRGPVSSGFRAVTASPICCAAWSKASGMATRDCYAAMGALPAELRLDGRCRALPGACARVLAAAVNAPVRVSRREEAGAAGAAMMAAVAIGAYPTMDDCIARLGHAAARRSRGAGRRRLVAPTTALFPAYVDGPQGTCARPGTRWPDAATTIASRRPTPDAAAHRRSTT